MDTAKIMVLITRLHSENKIAHDGLTFYEEKLDAIVEELNRTYNEISHSISIDFKDIATIKKLTPEWKFMCLNFYCLHLLKVHLTKDTLISVANTKLLRKYVENIVDIGILQNILPKLPFHKAIRRVEIGVEDTYYMLRASVLGLYYYTFSSSLGYYLLDITFPGLLVGIIQLGFCPIMKPSNIQRGSFIMTNEFYDEVTADQERCKEMLLYIKNHVSTHRFLLHLSLLMRRNVPRWFMDAIRPHLNYCLKQPNGIKTLFSLMDDVQENQPSLKPIIVGKIVSKSSRFEDFDSKILPQVGDLLYENNSDDEHIFLFGEILKHTYKENMDKGLMILEQLFSPLKQLTKNTKSSKIDSQKLSSGLMSAMKVVSYVFINSMDRLPMELLKSHVAILFNIYMFLDPSHFLNKSLKEILVKYFKGINKSERFNLLDNFIFNIEFPDLFICSNRLKILVASNILIVNLDDQNIKYDVIKSARSVLSLFQSEPELRLMIFTFLLSCLLEPKKYFPDVSLLTNEDEGYLSVFERKIAVFDLLKTLSSQEEVDNYFRNGIPLELLNYFKDIFDKALKTGAHNNIDHEDHQSIFTAALILESLFKKNVQDDKSSLINTVKRLHDETHNDELKSVLGRILKDSPIKGERIREGDEVEENIQCILSNCIATQGHGLIALKKMILAKHPKAVDRKQLIYTIFKNKLSDRDTYIYLAAINGLASIADLGTECTSMVLNTLCEEYREFPTEEFGCDATEMRLKVGEVLVKISKTLGEMAPHYKAQLLNTFLHGTKDEDHLVRASSLSNLGEICRVLGFKLGSIVTEILLCVHSIISSDKHDEPRRAAVLVIQQLLAGLGKDMISTLTEDILLVYRTLKFLYEHDKDDVLKLHCQLALEELNTNMKEILMPKYEVNQREKVVVLR